MTAQRALMSALATELFAPEVHEVAELFSITARSPWTGGRAGHADRIAAERPAICHAVA
jgi:hypothetical protein